MALRENDAFLTFIETYNICPWAKPARRSGEVERYFFAWNEFFTRSNEETLQTLVDKVATQEQTVVALFIFPELSHGAKQWEQAVKRFRKTYLQAEGARRVLACAPFHPDLPYSSRTPATLVKLFRRSPHPTIQLVRLDVLRSLSEGTQSQDMYMSYEDALELLKSNAPPPRESPSQQVTRQNFEKFKDKTELLEAELEACRRR